jgi:hypothetical protein
MGDKLFLDEFNMSHLNKSIDQLNHKKNKKQTTYTAREIANKIFDGELKDDDLIMDKNGSFDDIFNTKEYGIDTLIDYEPYIIKMDK